MDINNVNSFKLQAAKTTADTREKRACMSILKTLCYYAAKQEEASVYWPGQIVNDLQWILTQLNT